MRERPILFGGPMVRAILAGEKTQTRRMASHPLLQSLSFIVHSSEGWWGDEEGEVQVLCPYGQPGDRLWVRETFADLLGTGIEHRPDPSGPRQRYAFAADCPPGSASDEARKDFGVKWKPSIHMPRAASRILLEVVTVRVVRLQDISEADARAEGIRRHPDGHGWHVEDGSHYAADPRESFASLWASVGGPDSWAVNPWVWVVEFRRLSL